MTKEIKQKANKVEPMHYLICERYQKMHYIIHFD